MKKTIKDYITEITKAINEENPVNGLVISEKEVRAVIRYHLKNFKQVLEKNDNEIYITRKLWFYPVRKFVLGKQVRAERLRSRMQLQRLRIKSGKLRQG